VCIQELELYKPELVSKPAILIINKIDTEGAEKLCDETVKKVKNMQGYYFIFFTNCGALLSVLKYLPCF